MACSTDDIDSQRFGLRVTNQHEVLLDDGSKIVILRWQIYNGDIT